jgi:hypothetical protein
MVTRMRLFSQTTTFPAQPAGRPDRLGEDVPRPDTGEDRSSAAARSTGWRRSSRAASARLAGSMPESKKEKKEEKVGRLPQQLMLEPKRHAAKPSRTRSGRRIRTDAVGRGTTFSPSPKSTITMRQTSRTQLTTSFGCLGQIAKLGRPGRAADMQCPRAGAGRRCSTAA